MDNEKDQGIDPNHPHREVLELAERFIEDTLTDEDAARLESLVHDDEDALRAYTRYMHQHAALRWHRGQPADAGDESMLLRLASDDSGPRRHTARAAVRRAGWQRVVLFATAAAALLVAGAWVGFGVMSVLSVGDEDAVVATLSETQRCTWDAGTLPTEAGALLTSGRMRLTEGLATIRFRSGAKVVLEGPADLELVDPMKCILHAGVLVAEVPEPAQGFVVDTPKAQLIDHGTEFGVSVDDTGETVLQVFDGEVELKHGETGEVRRALTGANLRVREREVIDDDVFTEFNRAGVATPQPTYAASSISITTAAGVGRDTFVQDYKNREDYKTAPGVLMCKRNDGAGWNRKVYLAFDVSLLRDQRIADAEFVINAVPSGRGFAANLPDASFTVYGLIDESLDDWDTATIGWDNAPGNASGGHEVEADKVVPLGTFVIERGIQSGTRVVDGAALRELIARDTNGVVTLIITRETEGTRGGSLVHGLASSEHPTVAPPTLRVVLE